MKKLNSLMRCKISKQHFFFLLFLFLLCFSILYLSNEVEFILETLGTNMITQDVLLVYV